MDLRRLNLETLLFATASTIAAVLRFYNLGASPLTDEEAKWALQALQISTPLNKADFVIGPQPAYVFLTGILFYLFNANNFLQKYARLVIE